MLPVSLWLHQRVRTSQQLRKESMRTKYLGGAHMHHIGDLNLTVKSRKESRVYNPLNKDPVSSTSDHSAGLFKSV